MAENGPGRAGNAFVGLSSASRWRMTAAVRQMPDSRKSEAMQGYWTVSETVAELARLPLVPVMVSV